MKISVCRNTLIHGQVNALVAESDIQTLGDKHELRAERNWKIIDTAKSNNENKD